MILFSRNELMNMIEEHQRNDKQIMTGVTPIGQIEIEAVWDEDEEIKFSLLYAKIIGFRKAKKYVEFKLSKY